MVKSYGVQVFRVNMFLNIHVALDKALFSVLIFFLFLHKNMYYSFEVPH